MTKLIDKAIAIQKRAAKAEERVSELEAENARLRQQRDATNAQLDFILENTKCDTPFGQNASS